MCYAILKVRYRSTTERDAYVEVEALEQLEPKLTEVKGRPEVSSITVFRGTHTHSLVQEWKTVAHDE